MDFRHKDCGGLIDKKKKTCLGCGKDFSGVKWFTNTEFIPITESRQERLAKKVAGIDTGTSYASWGDSIPFVGFIASHLPNWPRKWRIVAFVLTYGSVLASIIWLWATNPTIAYYVTLAITIPVLVILILVGRLVWRILRN